MMKYVLEQKFYYVLQNIENPDLFLSKNNKWINLSGAITFLTDESAFHVKDRVDKKLIVRKIKVVSEITLLPE